MTELYYNIYSDTIFHLKYENMYIFITQNHFLKLILIKYTKNNPRI